MENHFALDNSLPCTTSPELSNDWYVKNEHECVRECDTGEACNGRAPNNSTFYSSFNDCCSNPGMIENSSCTAIVDNK